ncbi:hypothetical protein U9M48_011655 [Paspalum notatum var. saurae]|uniref:Uncharacterized protein n=1 Tax=Paspalum notatum var. saurae TaxID=547442 RepID=A0AAQ3SVW7_PASNO
MRSNRQAWLGGMNRRSQSKSGPATRINQLDWILGCSVLVRPWADHATLRLEHLGTSEGPTRGEPGRSISYWTWSGGHNNVTCSIRSISETKDTRAAISLQLSADVTPLLHYIVPDETLHLNHVGFVHGEHINIIGDAANIT